MQYISYLASRNMFFRICGICGEAFYADTHQRKYHKECAAKREKEIKMQSQHNIQRDTFFGLCYRERYSYNNFKKGKVYQNAPKALRDEYDALFERFKAQLKEQKDKLKKDKDSSAAFYCTLWHRRIKGEREDLENKFHSSLKG